MQYRNAGTQATFNHDLIVQPAITLLHDPDTCNAMNARVKRKMSWDMTTVDRLTDLGVYFFVNMG